MYMEHMAGSIVDTLNTVKDIGLILVLCCIIIVPHLSDLVYNQDKDYYVYMYAFLGSILHIPLKIKIGFDFISSESLIFT